MPCSFDVDGNPTHLFSGDTPGATCQCGLRTRPANPTYPITVNGNEVQTNGGRYNGRKIRQIGGVPDDHDLWQRWRAGDDRRIGDDDIVVTAGTPEFYSAPREIND